MRCPACGRPPQSELDAGKEALLPGEPVDQGCYQEFQTEYSRLKALTPVPTNKDAADKALTLAQNNHSTREKAVFDAKTLLWLQRNAQGLHALTGLPMVKTVRDVGGMPVVVAGVIQTTAYTVGEMTMIKAEYQRKLDDRMRADDKGAKTPGQRAAEEMGL